MNGEREVVISKPAAELMASYFQFIDELRANADQVWESMVPRTGEAATDFVARLTAPPLASTVTTYWCTIAGTVVGRGVLRHQLTPELAEFGGHISYEVRPSHRRQGIATEMIRQILSTDGARAIGALLITCDPTNIGSNRAIRANGGRLVKTAFVERVNRETSYYTMDGRRAPAGA